MKQKKKLSLSGYPLMIQPAASFMGMIPPLPPLRIPKYYSLLTQTGNIVIGEPYYENNLSQLCIGTPLKDEDGNAKGYLIGSYKYDILNDVVSQLVLGNTGTACILNEDGDIIGDQDLQNVIDQKNIYELYPSSANTKIFDKLLHFKSVPLK